MVRSLLVAVLASLAFGPTAHAGAPAKPDTALDLPKWEPNTKVFDFPTGLRVLFQADNAYPIVSVYMIVNHGSADDPEGKDEVAHFVEHTWFRSVHGELPPIMDVVNDLSGFFNASTWNDWTNYSTVAHSQYLPILLKLESLRLTEFYKGMTEEQTITEREVIRNEWRRRNENNVQLIFDYLYNAVYPAGHPYHSTSTHDTIDNIELADLQGYVDRYYRPDQTTVTIVGDFDPREAASLIFENFDLSLLHPKLTPDMLFQAPRPGVENPDPNNPAHWLTGAYDPDEFLKGRKVPFDFVDMEKVRPRVTAQRAPVPELGSKEVVRAKAPVDYTTAVIGWSLPGGYRADDLELRFLGNFASAFASSAKSQFPSGTIGDIGCFTQAEVVNSTLMCYAEVKSSKVRAEDVVEKMIDQMSEIWNVENTAGAQFNFSRGKQELLAGELMSMDNVAAVFAGRADNLGTYTHLTGDPNYYSRLLSQIGGLSVTRMQELAATYLKRDRVARLIVEKLPEEEVDTTSSESGYVGASRADDALRASDDISKVTEPEIVGARVTPEVAKIEDFKLPNGMRVVIMPHGEVPLARAGVILGGGPANEVRGLYDFVTSFTIGAAADPLQVAGTSSWPFFTIPGYLSQSYPLAGAAIAPNASRIDVSMPAGNLDAGLWILRSELDGIKPYLDGASEWKKDRRSGLKSNWTKSAWHIGDLTSQHLFPGVQEQQQWTWADVDVAQSFTTSTVTDWYAKYVHPGNAVLLIVGNIKTADAKKLAETYFGDWKGHGDPAQGWQGALQVPELPTQPMKIYVFNDEKKTQSQTDFACRLDYRSERDRPAVGVLGSLVGTRVFNQLRVVEALSYTPFAFGAVNDDGSAMLYMSSLALNKGVGRTVEYFFEAARTFEADEVGGDEITLHKLREARGNGLGAQSIGGMLNTLSGVIRRGEDWSALSDAGKDVARVSPTQLKRLITGCADHAIVTIEGPKDVITAQLDEKGYKYEVIDFKERGDALLKEFDPKAYDKKMAS
jgi:zinc protease